MTEPVLIKTWNELRQQTSPTHVLEIEEDGHSGYIRSKTDKSDWHYLSTHTFYGSTHASSTKRLQQCGFNVVLYNWDESTT